jgi:hypothetical protein
MLEILWLQYSPIGMITSCLSSEKEGGSSSSYSCKTDSSSFILTLKKSNYLI